MIKKIFALLFALSMCLSLYSCSRAGGSGSDNGEGSVYYMNFKPEADKAWQALAKSYTDKTGVKVKVLTAASGDYENTLIAEMDKKEAPTLFQVSNQSALKTWGDYCYDLKNTDFYKEMTTDGFNLTDKDGKVLAAGYCYEAYGIIVNTKLLRKAGYDVEAIKNYDTLKKVADDIHKRSKELGFDAFAAAGLESSSSWRFSGHLANMPLFYEFRDEKINSQPEKIKGSYLESFKNIWDLYITDSPTTGAALLTSTGDAAAAQFKEEKVCFWQNGSWEYQNLISAGMKAEDLDMIPIYCGVDGEEKAGLCCGTENCWAVNKDADEKDIKATLDFMHWVVTSEAGTKMLAEQFGPCPFKKAKTPENPFFAKANEYIEKGNYVVTWDFSYTPGVDEWRAALTDALGRYTAAGGSWEDVKATFVDGWSTQYKKENS